MNYTNDYNGVLPLHDNSGTKPLRWGQFITGSFGGSDYIGNDTVLSCPSFYFTYESFSKPFTYGSNRTYSYIKISNMPSPGETWILGDSVFYYSDWECFIQIYLINMNPTDITKGGVHLRHHNLANILFLDGHVKPYNKTDALSNLGIEKGYNKSKALISF